MPKEITIKGKGLRQNQIAVLRLLYEGPVHVRADGIQAVWRRLGDSEANIAAIHGFSDFHIYLYSGFIEDFVPMDERETQGKFVEIPNGKRSRLRHTIYSLWERGLVVVFTRKVEKMRKGYRRVPHVFERFKTNQGRSGELLGLTLSTEGLLWCRKMLDGEDITDKNVIFD